MVSTSGLTRRLLNGSVFAALTVFTGCASQNLRIVTDPPSSRVSVTNADGKAELASAAPASIKFDRSVTVHVDPPAGQENNWQPATVSVDEQQYRQLPAAAGEKDTKEITIRLEKKEFQELVYVELILDPEGQVRGLITSSRAYFATTESGGAVPRRVVDFGENLGIQGLSLSPTGDRICYSVASFDRPPNLASLAATGNIIPLRGCNLKAVALAGGGIQQITSEDFEDMFPSYTPDGEYILISSNRRRPHRADLLRIPASARGGITNIYVDPRDALILRPSQSKDETIAFAYYPEPGNPRRAEIWTIGGTSRFPTQIAQGSQPMISPKGDKIAYIGNDGNLWVTDLTGGNQVQLTSGAAEIFNRFVASLSPAEKRIFDAHRELFVRAVNPYSFPSWSPDGQYILYTGMEGTDSTGRPNEDIWIMRADGAGKQQLTTNFSADRYPLMSPDMKLIYFMSNRGGHWGIWSIDSPVGLKNAKADGKG